MTLINLLMEYDLRFVFVQTKVKQTQVPNQRAHLGIQLHGGSQGEDIIERSQWSLNESPRCYKNGNFSPNVEAMVGT